MELHTLRRLPTLPSRDLANFALPILARVTLQELRCQSLARDFASFTLQTFARNFANFARYIFAHLTVQLHAAWYAKPLRW